MSFSVSYVITGRDELSKVLAKITTNLEKLDLAAQKLNRTMASLSSAKGGFMKGASAIAAMSAAISSMDVGKMRAVNEQFAKMQRSASRATSGGGRRGGTTSAAPSNLPAIMARAQRVYEGEYIPRGGGGGGGARRGRTYAGDYSEIFRALPGPAMSPSAMARAIPGPAMSPSAMARALGTGTRAPSGFVGPSMPGSVALGRGLQRLGQQALTAAASVGQLGAAARKSTPSLGFIAGEAFAAATLAAPAALPVMAYAKQESVAKTFEMMFGAGEGGALFKKTMGFGAGSVFGMEQVIEASQKLSMAGIGAKELPKTMEDLGNIAAVSGGKIDEIAWAYSRIHRMGIATNEELELMTDRNVDALGIIQRYLKDVKGVEVSYMAIRKAAENQALAASLVEASFAHFGELQKKATAERLKTLSGMWENLKFNASAFFGTIGKAESDAIGLHARLKDISNFFRTHEFIPYEKWALWQKVLGWTAAVVLGLSAVAAVLGIIGGLLTFVFGKFMLIFTGIGYVIRGAIFLVGALTAPLWATIAVIGLMGLAVWYFWDDIQAAWGGLPDWWDSISKELTDTNNWTWDNIVQKAAVAAQKLFLYSSAIAHAFRLDFAGAEKQFETAWNMSWSGQPAQQGTVTVNVNTPAGAETEVEGSGVRVQTNSLGRGYTDDWGTPSMAGGW